MRKSTGPKSRALASLLAALVVALFLVPEAPAQVPWTDPPYWSGTGRYDVVVGHTGLCVPMLPQYPQSHSFTLDVPGALEHAVILWGGIDYDWTDSDRAESITLEIDGTPNTVNAVGIMEYSWTADWRDPPDLTDNGYWVRYADVTALIASGSHSYQITPSVPQSWEVLTFGAQLYAVYSSSSLPRRTLEVRLGIDFGMNGWPHPLGGEGEIHCQTLYPSSGSQEYELLLGVIGVEEHRGRRFWWRTGTGAIPPEMAANLSTEGDVIEHPEAQSIDMPFSTAGGRESAIHRQTIPIPAGHSWVCFQLDSERLVDEASCPISEYPWCHGLGMSEQECGGASFLNAVWIHMLSLSRPRPVLVR